MTPKEKAQQLIDKFTFSDTCFTNKNNGSLVNAKLCAILCVDEIDLLIQKSTPKDDLYSNLLALEYWQEVKTEIQNL